MAVTFGEHVSITLPQARVEALVRKPGYAPFIAAGGRAMAGWVLADNERVAALGVDASLFDEAIAHVRTKAAKAKAPKAKAVASRRAAEETNGGVAAALTRIFRIEWTSDELIALDSHAPRIPPRKHGSPAIWQSPANVVPPTTGAPNVRLQATPVLLAPMALGGPSRS